jgi:uncharacterized protein (TIGR02646 family)
MIRINKNPKDCPSILLNQGAKQTRKDCQSYTRASKKPDNKYLTGKKFPNLKYYSSSTVKKALLKSHNSKCCYCEQRRRPSELAVEHFRPRTAFKRSVKGSYNYPGYFWLAYSWINLYLSCAECNSRFKGSVFPLVNEADRAKNEKDDIKKEQPLLIDPGEDNPRDHIQFKFDKPIFFSYRGEQTIEILQLNEENLRKEREEKLSVIQSLIDLVNLAEERKDADWDKTAANARRILDESILPQSSFSSMIHDYLFDIGYLKIKVL